MIQTGIGPIEVRRQKVRDPLPGSRMHAFDERGAIDLPVEAKIRLTSNILPSEPLAAIGSKPGANARRSKSLDALLPVLYLRGISTGDFQEALSALLGQDAPNLSPGVITRLTAGWQEEYDRWQGRDLSARRYVVRPLSRTGGVRGLTCG